MNRAAHVRGRRTWIGMVIAASVAITGGCTTGHPTVALPGEGVETPWWAAITSTTSPPTTVGGTPGGNEESVVVVTVNAPADVLFDENSAALTDAANPVLDRLAAEISQRAIGPITVSGSTDHYGTHTTNMALGLARATTVMEALADRGINATSMTARSVGDTAPLCHEIRLDGTDDADCRARDRRVTLTYNVVATPTGTGTR